MISYLDDRNYPPLDSDPAAPGNALEAQAGGAIASWIGDTFFGGNEKKEKEIQKIKDDPTAQKKVDSYFADQQKELDETFTGKPSSSAVNYRDAAEQALNRLTDEYDRVYGGKGGINEQVASAYGAASARGAEGVKNIYNEGQRAASAIDTLYGGAAARAQGAAASSGVLPVSGDAVYTPTTTRAYGSTIADYTGGASTITARDLSRSNASRSGSRTISIDDWARTSMLEMRSALDLEFDFAIRQAKSDKEAANLQFAKDKAADKLNNIKDKNLLDEVRNYWDAEDDERLPDNAQRQATKNSIRARFDSEKEYLAAVENYIRAGSRKILTDFINPPSLYDETTGNLK